MAAVFHLLTRLTAADTAHHILSFLVTVRPTSTWYNGRMIHVGPPPNRQVLEQLPLDTGDWMLKEVRGREHVYASTRTRRDRIMLQHLCDTRIRVKHIIRTSMSLPFSDVRSYGTTCHTLLFDFKGGQWKPHVYAKWCYDIPGIYHVKRLRRVLMNDTAAGAVAWPAGPREKARACMWSP